LPGGRAQLDESADRQAARPEAADTRTLVLLVRRWRDSESWWQAMCPGINDLYTFTN
jgi:hypothetical protein